MKGSSRAGTTACGVNVQTKADSDPRAAVFDPKTSTSRLGKASTLHRAQIAPLPNGRVLVTADFERYDVHLPQVFDVARETAE